MWPTNNSSREIPNGSHNGNSSCAQCVYFYVITAILTDCPPSPIPAASRSKSWVYGRSLAVIASSNPARGMTVSCECCMLSGRGLCDGLISRPEKSSRVWCVITTPR